MTKIARTRWGGLADGTETPGSFFRVAERGGVWWLIDPDGGRFLSKGIDTVRFDQDKIQNSDRIPYAEHCARKYGSEDAWRRAVAARIAGWGFNTLGSWSDELVARNAPLALTPNLDLGMSFAWQTNDAAKDKPRQEFPDVFDPAFERHVRRRALELCAPRRDDASIIGWFIDNELRWGPDWRGKEELLALFLSLVPGTPGRDAALTFRDDETFAGKVAERYFALTVAAIKAADPNHLVLGARFALPPRRAVIEACGRHTDVLSFNSYGDDPAQDIATYAISGKPSLIGEFSLRAEDSGLPNTRGAGPIVGTQADRAAGFRRYVKSALRKPSVVGYHWFEHADQPAEGRFDGENSNFGVVTIRDDVYEALTQAMAGVNADAEKIHAGEKKP